MMPGTLDRRLARLEAGKAPPLRQRYVWLRSADHPVPEAEPGERIVVVHWIWDEEFGEPSR